MTFRLILSIPIDSSVDTLTPEQTEKIAVVNGRWTRGGMPGTLPAGERYLIDVLTDVQVTRQMLDALDLQSWRIVGCWSWSLVSGDPLTVVQPLDESLYLPHLPDTVLREASGWGGWPACIGGAPS